MFWVLAPCRLDGKSQHCTETYFLQLQSLCDFHFLVSSLQLWWWWQYVPPKCWHLLMSLLGAESQKVKIIIIIIILLITMKTSNLTQTSAASVKMASWYVFDQQFCISHYIQVCSVVPWSVWRIYCSVCHKHG
jgi:hypothetical protein